MSHSTATFRLSDGTIYYGEFNGTVDVLLPFIYKTEEERNNNWRPHSWKYCSNPKEHKHEKAEVAVTYGGGWNWIITICRECMVAIDPLSLECMGSDTEFSFPNDGIPDWYPNRELY